jgi:hypothetical protein
MHFSAICYTLPPNSTAKLAPVERVARAWPVNRDGIYGAVMLPKY